MWGRDVQCISRFELKGVGEVVEVHWGSGGESFPLRSSRDASRPTPSCGGYPRNAPDTESSRRACSVPPLRGSYGPAPSGAFAPPAARRRVPPWRCAPGSLQPTLAWRRYAPRVRTSGNDACQRTVRWWTIQAMTRGQDSTISPRRPSMMGVHHGL